MDARRPRCRRPVELLAGGGRNNGRDGTTLRFETELTFEPADGGTRMTMIQRGIPFTYAPATELDLRGFGAVIYTAGFRPDFGWIDALPGDAFGFPVTADGAAPDLPGLFFCGLHFMRVRRSGTLFGVGADAEIVAEAIALVRA